MEMEWADVNEVEDGNMECVLCGVGVSRGWMLLLLLDWLRELIECCRGGGGGLRLTVSAQSSAEQEVLRVTLCSSQYVNQRVR